MSRGRRTALVAASVVLAGVGALGALAYVASAHSDRVLAAVGKGLGREVRAARLGVTLRGGVGVALTDVAIADEPGRGDEPFLTAQRFALRLRLLPLLRGRLVVDRVVVDAPIVNLVRDAAGHLNVDSLGRRSDAAETNEREAGSGGQGRPAIQLGALRLRHGTIRYRDGDGGRAFTLDDVAVDAREPHFGAPIPVSLRARLAGDGLRLDAIESEGVLDMGSARPAYRGTLRAGPGRLGTLPLERVEGTVQASPPVLTLERATVALLGGTVHGQGRVTSGGDGAGLTAEMAAAGLDLAQLPARPERPHPGGKLSLQGTLSGPAPGSPRFRAGLAGSGRFEVADGRVEDVPLGRTVRDLLAPVFGADTAARLRERYPDLFGGDDLRFTRLSGSGQLAGGRITTDDLVLVGESYRATGAGSLGLDGTVELGLRLVASPALTTDLLGRSKARPVVVDANGQLTVPLRVRGTLRHPHVTPDPEFASSVARALLGGTGLENAAGGLLERLFGGKKGGR